MASNRQSATGSSNNVSIANSKSDIVDDLNKLIINSTENKKVNKKTVANSTGGKQQKLEGSNSSNIVTKPKSPKKSKQNFVNNTNDDKAVISPSKSSYSTVTVAADSASVKSNDSGISNTPNLSPSPSPTSFIPSENYNNEGAIIYDDNDSTNISSTIIDNSPMALYSTVTTVDTPTSTGPGGGTTYYNYGIIPSTNTSDLSSTLIDPSTSRTYYNTVYPNDTVYYENSSSTNKCVNGEETETYKAKSSLCAETQQRHAVLCYEQVCRLNDVMNEVVSIHGRGNFPTLEVRLRDLVTVVRDKLEADPSNGGAGMKVRDIRLNGGAASHVLATESQPYNDLDLIFAIELSNTKNYDKVKASVLDSLFDLLPEGVSRKRITTSSLKEAYVSKMVKVNNDGDRWSLISLGNSRGHRNVELKFVDSMRRQFEFSVDSFQIVLDSLLLFYERSKVQMGENLYPTIVGESVYGDFHEAIYHLQKKLISTRHPEEIRGGGLLKYCNLLVKNYKPAQPDYIKTLERYMCSRFFIDFPDIQQQRAKLESYLWNHFVGPEEEQLKYQYLMLLHSVVEESTVCLMGHERRQTLALIENLAYQVLCQEQQQRLNHHQHHPPPHHQHHPHHHQIQTGPPPPPAPPHYVYANGYYYAPVLPATCYQCTCNSWMACSS